MCSLNPLFTLPPDVLCVCDEDDSGAELLVFGLPRDAAILCDEPGSPVSENFLFSSVGLS